LGIGSQEIWFKMIGRVYPLIRIWFVY